MIETKQKSIDGDIYQVTQLPARRAIKAKVALFKIFGVALAKVYESVSSEDKKKKSSKNSEKEKSELVGAIESLASTIDEESLLNIIQILIYGVRKNGKELTPEICDLEFAGNLDTLYKVLWFVIEVNFANFFSMLGVHIGSESPQEQAHEPATTKKIFRTS